MDRVRLTEDDINSLVRTYLEALGWRDVVALKGNARGVDVSGVDELGVTRVQVESKGGTSGRAGSVKFGSLFDSGQVNTHIPEAVYKALCYRERSASNRILIAVPDDEMHLTRITPVEKTLRTLDIGLLAVSEMGVRPVFGATQPPDSHGSPAPRRD